MVVNGRRCCFADGDVLDVTHEIYVINYVQGQYASDEFNHGEYVDWEGFKSALIKEELGKQFGLSDSDVKEKALLKKIKEIGMTKIVKSRCSI